MSRGPIAALREESTVRAAFAVLAIAIGAAVGYSFADNTRLGLPVLLGLLLLALALYRPASIAVLAFVGTFFVERLGSASASAGPHGGVSYSDALLAAASVMALPAMLGRRQTGRLRPALTGLGAYLAALVLGVIAHPSSRAYLEWAHRLVLVGGALLVGAWIARENLVRVTMRWFLGIAFIVALFAVRYSFTHAFQPAYPLGMHKNFVGAQLGTAFVLMIVLRRQFRLRTGTWVVALIIVALGLVASQSRGAELGAAVALLLAFLLDGRSHSRAAKVGSLLIGITIAVFAVLSVRSQLDATTDGPTEHGSIGTRFSVEAETRAIWREHPWAGAGLKYFLSGEYGYFAQAPNNVVDNELAESGIIGLAGFSIMQIAIIGVGFVRRRDGTLVVCGVALVVGQLLHGQVDVYWTAGVVSLPFLVLGMGLVFTGDGRINGDQPNSGPRTSTEAWPYT